jgi:hypothetical protein
MAEPQQDQNTTGDYVVARDKAERFAERVLLIIYRLSEEHSFPYTSPEASSLLGYACNSRLRDNVEPRMELLSIISNAYQSFLLWGPDMPADVRLRQSFQLRYIILWFFRVGSFVGIDKHNSTWIEAIRAVSEVAEEIQAQLPTPTASFSQLNFVVNGFQV